ncbi:hypothetical protein NOC27_3134 [Nitrosococcus oceani AFC27]|nr:hypothetical protein NOC27_3134 [Nitrosococcus oceani AFC27]
MEKIRDCFAVEQCLGKRHLISVVIRQQYWLRNNMHFDQNDYPKIKAAC